MRERSQCVLLKWDIYSEVKALVFFQISEVEEGTFVKSRRHKIQISGCWFFYTCPSTKKQVLVKNIKRSISEVLPFFITWVYHTSLYLEINDYISKRVLSEMVVAFLNDYILNILFSAKRALAERMPFKLHSLKQWPLVHCPHLQFHCQTRWACMSGLLDEPFLGMKYWSLWSMNKISIILQEAESFSLILCVLGAFNAELLI